MTDRQPALLDTSFWTVGHRADVLSYVFEYFAVVVPPAVRAEILAPDPRFPQRRYGYAALFRLLEERGLFQTDLPVNAAGRFGRGEAEALALAEAHAAWLLINDYRPLIFARQAGLRTLSVPSFITALYHHGRLSLASAERKLGLITSVTSNDMLDAARQSIDQLARQRKERV